MPNALSTTKIFRTLTVGVVMVSVVTTSGYSLAAESISTLAADAQKEVAKKQDKLDEINKKIKAYNDIINLKQQQRTTLSGQVTALENQAAKLTLEIEKNQNQIEDIGQDMDRLQSQIATHEKELAFQKDLLIGLMRTYYENRGQSQLQFLLSEKESADLSQQEDWTLEAGSKIQETLENIRTLHDTLVSQHASLGEKKSQADSLQLQLDQRNSYLESTKQSKEALISQTKLEEKKYNNLVDDLEEQRKDIEEEIENLESAKVDQLDLSKLPAFNKSTLFYPVANPNISQRYGKTTFTRWYKFHNGMDFSGKVGTPLYAAADGTVLATGNLGNLAYGKWIAIDHGNGLVTLYGHLSSQGVSKGDKVKKGEKIGLMGSTGYSTGPHVHFGVYAKNSFDIIPYKGKMLPTGAHVNPAKYLP